ncbi:MAG: hypothetical protein JOZ01_08930 [Candidatus Eremiobacteraeota bacterium]|nr:hypothetical protein [Candidatus Eremiobacteraeota bacterium]
MAVLFAALSLPTAVSAQVTQQPQAQMQQAPHNQAAAQYKRWTKRLNGINLSSQQQQQIQHLLDQFAAAHPAGSPRDKAGVHALRDQIFGVLNSQQQTQLRQNIQAMEARERERRMQMQPQQQPVQPAPPSR